MSIPRYKINPLFGYLKDAKEGKFCEYRDYLKLEKECTFLKDTVSNCMQAVIARESEIARLKNEVERLEHQVNYWRIEANTDHARWLRCLQDLEELRASSFVTAVPCEQYERVIKAGDELHIFLISYIVEGRISSSYLNELDDNWNAAKEGKSQP